MTFDITDDRLSPARPAPSRERRVRKTLFATAIASILLAGCASPYHPQGCEATSSPPPVAATGKSGSKPGKKESARRDASVKRKAADTRASASPMGRPRRGEATYYASYFEGRPTASVEPYDSQAMTAAHKTLPFGTKVKVTALDSGETAVVRINDRGPFVDGRIIDLSRKAAEQLGMVQEGAAEVQLQVLGQ